MSGRDFWKRVEELRKKGMEEEEAIERVETEFKDALRKELEEEIRRELKDEKEEVAARIRLQESRWSMWMRAIVVTTFALIGPIMLVGVRIGLVESTLIPTVLDIFKIWLGAAIGISTNLLQRRDQAPVAAAAPQQ